MKKQLILCSIAAILLSMSGSGIMTSLHKEFTPELCADLYASKNNIYGIDYQVKKQIYQIYSCDMECKNMISIRQKAQKNNRRFVYDMIIYDNKDKQVYVHLSEFACDTGLIEQESVLECDFKKQKLKPVWKISSDKSGRTSSFAMTCTVQEGVLYYLAENSEGGYRVYKYGDGEKSVVRNIEAPDEMTFSEYRFDENGILYAFSTVGGLYKENSEGKIKPINGEEGEWNSYIGPAWGENCAAYFDLNNNKEIKYFQNTDKTSQIPMIQSYTQTRIEGQNASVCTVKADMLTNNFILSDGGFAAYTELPEKLKNDETHLKSALMIYQNNKSIVYPCLTYGKNYLLKFSLKWFLVFLGIIFLIFAAVFSVYSVVRKKTYISIRLEVTLFAVILFGSAIGVTSYIINNIMTQSFNESYQKVFDDLEQEICCELDTLIEQTENFTKETLFSKSFYDSLDRIMCNTSIRNLSTGEEEFAPYFVFHAVNSNNQLEVLYNSSGKVRIPTSYAYNNAYLEKEYQTVLTKHISQNLTQYDTEGTWNIQLCSYENSEYGVSAVVEIGIDQYLTDWKTSQITLSIIRFIVILCALMVALVIIFLSLSFGPIRRLGIQVEKGDVDKPGKSRWNIETSAVWEQLYVMIKNAKRQQEELELNNQQHYRFISQKLVQLLGLNELADAEPGISRKCSVYIVHAVFEKKELEVINKVYEKIIPQVEKMGGIVCTMDCLHIVFLFRSGSGNPLASADIIHKSALAKNIQCGVGIGSGIITVFVRGTEEYSDISAAGKEAMLAERLAKISIEKKQCIMTKEAAVLTDIMGWRKQPADNMPENICGYLLLEAKKDKIH